MKRAKLAGLVVALLATSVMAGCNMVEKKKYDTLESKYHEQENLNKDLTAKLAAAEAGQADLQNGATAAQQRAMAAEAESARLRNELANQQVAQAKATEPTAAAAAHGKTKTATHAAERTVPGSEFVLSGEMLTGSSKISLTAAGKKRLAEVAKAIKNQYAGHTVRVCGNTDGDPIHKSHWQDNLELSCERALVVARELAEAGVPAKNIEVVGLGQYHPVAENSSAAGKTKNRRVVIEIMK